VNAGVTIIQSVLAAGAVLALFRAVRGPNIIDRAIALDVVLLLLAGGLAAQEARAGTELFLPVIVVVALVGFAGTIIVARFIEWRDTE
jgi:multicomponent Na+:H+ antiporter subunit F